MSSCFIWSWAKAAREAARTQVNVRVLRIRFMSRSCEIELSFRQAGSSPAGENGMCRTRESYNPGHFVGDTYRPNRTMESACLAADTPSQECFLGRRSLDGEAFRW